MNREYGILMVVLVMSMLVSMLVMEIWERISEEKKDREKESAYECGFNPFMEEKSGYEMRYYKLGIMYIIMDVEISYMYPWSIGMVEIGKEGVVGGIIFMLMLTIGYVYEWKKGGIEWE
uniref:NADH-ubiquinone oxidoreductase chain 3 n=1 Tax=Galdieria phlegrea TaxID=1389228 RepID=A0A7H0WB59_9RHOD|nr:NADH dehydrogenase subunit 3 [Galdieria phlegrea]QNR39788.1 NADH dehydrogenase subunit 3 [Galdieria phlegrea]